MLFLVSYQAKTTTVDLKEVLERHARAEVVTIFPHCAWLVRRPDAESPQDLLELIRASTLRILDDSLFVTEVCGNPACSNTITSRHLIEQTYSESARRGK